MLMQNSAFLCFASVYYSTPPQRRIVYYRIFWQNLALIKMEKCVNARNFHFERRIFSIRLTMVPFAWYNMYMQHKAAVAIAKRR